MKTVAIIQARMGSTRMPGKSLETLGDQKVLDWVVRAARSISGVNEVVVATSSDASDLPIVEHCRNNKIACFSGSLDDVLGRYYHAALEHKADVVLRLTGDCPFLDPDLCGTLLYHFEKTKVDYASNVLLSTWPDGLDCEILSFKALEKAHKESVAKTHREHVTQYIHHNRQIFQVYNLVCPIPGLQTERWTLDRPDDFKFLSAVAQHLPKDRAPKYLEILRVLEKHPEYRNINSAIIRNEGLEITKKKDAAAGVRKNFSRSTAMLERAEKCIPLGSQTFSKSRTQYPVGHSPLYVTHGVGGRTWDTDGNEYVDLVNALLPNVLGYADPDVNEAVRKQLDNGICMSLATELEVQLSEVLVDLIPCAEGVRFGKNGGDATTGCIRVARAHTGRERVIACGYHGWHDWYIGTTTRNKGVPKAVQDLTHSVPYNDLQAVEDVLKKHPNEFACMILEPMNYVEPDKNYLSELKALLHRHDVLLVFDEVITGFRYSMGGAQEYFGVTPDLASFGKSMGNGMPISAVVGRRDVMKQMEDIFFSTTFGGETLSLAASLAVIDKMKKKNVIEKLWQTGGDLRSRVNTLISRYDLNSVMEFKGKDSWYLLAMQGYKNEPVEVVKTFFLHELHQRGVLTIGTHNICYAHSPDDVQHVVNGYDGALARLREELDLQNMTSRMKTPIVRPLFKVR
ncbi:MAG: aminotransferase class III-fold pyridoxal phosphate-dependent enzyme [Bdellovibrionota bacterium]